MHPISNEKKGGKKVAKFTIIKRELVDELKMLYSMKIDNTYVVVEEYNEFSTIFQYSKKYDQVKMITVKTENLDPTKRLQEG